MKAFGPEHTAAITSVQDVKSSLMPFGCLTNHRKDESIPYYFYNSLMSKPGWVNKILCKPQMKCVCQGVPMIGKGKYTVFLSVVDENFKKYSSE